MLEEGVGDHGHERMTVKALPGSSFEVVEAEFFFQLLMGLLADPSRLDGGGERDIWDVPLAGTAAPGNGPDELHVDRVHLEMTRNADSPGQASSRQRPDGALIP